MPRSFGGGGFGLHTLHSLPLNSADLGTTLHNSSKEKDTQPCVDSGTEKLQKVWSLKKEKSGIIKKRNKHPYSPLCCSNGAMLQLSHVGFKTENWGITWPLIAQFRSAQSGEQSPLSSSSAHRSARKGRAGQVSAAGSGSQLCAERQGKLPIRQSVLLGFFQSLEWLCHISWLWAMSHY